MLPTAVNMQNKRDPEGQHEKKQFFYSQGLQPVVVWLLG